MQSLDYPFGFDRPEDSPGFSLWHTTILWQRKIKKALEEYDIPHAAFVIMATLYWFEIHKYQTTQIIISRWSKLDKMTVSKTLKHLASLKFISRNENKQDSRAKNVLLTQSGKDLVKILVPIVEAIDATFFGKIKTQDQTNLISYLNQLVLHNSNPI